MMQNESDMNLLKSHWHGGAKMKYNFAFYQKYTKVMLSFMANSAFVERYFFSKARILVTKGKPNLDPMTMQKILFIHENYELITILTIF